MMMGTADEVVKSPEKGTVFVEDLPEEEQVVAVVSLNSYTYITWNCKISVFVIFITVVVLK